MPGYEWNEGSFQVKFLAHSLGKSLWVSLWIVDIPGELILQQSRAGHNFEPACDLLALERLEERIVHLGARTLQSRGVPGLISALSSLSCTCAPAAVSP